MVACLANPGLDPPPPTSTLPSPKLSLRCADHVWMSGVRPLCGGVFVGLSSRGPLQHALRRPVRPVSQIFMIHTYTDIYIYL